MALPSVKWRGWGSGAALPAIGGQQETAPSGCTGWPSAGHSPPRGAVVGSGDAAAAGELACEWAQRPQGTRVREARAPIAAKPQRRPLVCAKRPNERSEREPRGECASRGRQRQNNPRPLLAHRSAADAPGRRERWPRDSSRQKAQRARAHRGRLLARGRAGNPWDTAEGR